MRRTSIQRGLLRSCARRLRPGAALVAVPALLLHAQMLQAKEQPAPPPALRIDGGSRVVQPAESEAASSSLSKAAPDAAPPKAKTHKTGRRPRTPAASMPEGVPLSVPSDRSRHAIAEGATREELAKVAPDDQLRALREAETVLFPRRVRGLAPGWSFELPESQESSGVSLPLTVRRSSGPEISAEDAAWVRSLTLPDLPVRIDQRVVTYLKFYRDSHRGRTIAAIWARKSGRYVAAMKAELRRAGLPSDLVWLSMIESGHNPTIVSPAGAMGLWQFMPESGRMYGLTVDRWVDERRDPARSTQAAIRFLGDLYQRFGNWELAMGAYNMGYAGMSRAISKYNTNDYWMLSRLESGIPWETTLYVPKIFALAIVMNNRSAFGLSRIKPDAAQRLDSIRVEPATKLAEVAKASGLSQAELKKLNPQFLSDRVPPSTSSTTRFVVRVPRGRGKQTLAKMSRAARRHGVVQVRLGDDLDSLARQHSVSRRALERENALKRRQRVAPGTVLLLPKGAKQVAAGPTKDAVVVSRRVEPGDGQKLVFYRVLRGDDLELIASAFDVTVADVARWNALDSRARLRGGMTLQLVVPQAAKLSSVRHFDLTGNRPVLVAGTPEFHEYYEGLRGKRRVEIVVRKGDTLSKVGRRYGMSVGSMERVNRRSRRSSLIPGERLVVYTSKKVVAADAGGVEPLPEIEAPHPERLPAAGATAKD